MVNYTIEKMGKGVSVKMGKLRLLGAVGFLFLFLFFSCSKMEGNIKAKILILNDASIVYPGTELYFDVNVEGGTPPYLYTWNFGDGSTSSEKSPSHAFANPGLYTISVEVRDSNNNVFIASTTKQISTPGQVPMTVEFTSNTSVGYVPFNAVFTVNLTISPIPESLRNKPTVTLKFKWNFGDSTEDIIEERTITLPTTVSYTGTFTTTHTYLTSGTYPVRLTVIDPFLQLHEAATNVVITAYTKEKIWAQDGGNPLRTFSSATISSPSTIHSVWSTSLPNADAIPAPPIAIGNYLYFGATDRWFYALDLSSGNMRRFPLIDTSEGIRGSPVSLSSVGYYDPTMNTNVIFTVGMDGVIYRIHDNFSNEPTSKIVDSSIYQNAHHSVTDQNGTVLVDSPTAIPLTQANGTLSLYVDNNLNEGRLFVASTYLIYSYLTAWNRIAPFSHYPAQEEKPTVIKGTSLYPFWVNETYSPITFNGVVYDPATQHNYYYRDLSVLWRSPVFDVNLGFDIHHNVTSLTYLPTWNYLVVTDEKGLYLLENALAAAYAYPEGYPQEGFPEKPILKWGLNFGDTVVPPVIDEYRGLIFYATKNGTVGIVDLGTGQNLAGVSVSLTGINTIHTANGMIYITTGNELIALDLARLESGETDLNKLVRWRVSFDSTPTGLAVGGVYGCIGSGDTLYVINLLTGRIERSISLGEKILHTPIVAATESGQPVIVVMTTGKISAFAE